MRFQCTCTGRTRRSLPLGGVALERSRTAGTSSIKGSLYTLLLTHKWVPIGVHFQKGHVLSIATDGLYLLETAQELRLARSLSSLHSKVCMEIRPLQTPAHVQGRNVGLCKAKPPGVEMVFSHYFYCCF